MAGKTKPLGPRQRLAYIKPFREALATARTTLAAQIAQRDKAAKARDALRFTALFRKAQGIDTTLGDTFDVVVYGLNPKTPKERRLARAALIDGTMKVTVNGGSPGVPALTKRMRLMERADIRRLRGIDKRLDNLRQQKEALIVASFERGKELTPTQIADHLLKRAAINNADRAWIDSHIVVRAESALAEAEKHDGTKTCPCQACLWERQRIERDKANAKARVDREKAEIRRLAKLGTRDFTCPECQHENVAAQVELDENDGEKFVECSECESGTLLEDLVEAAKVVAPSPGQIAMLPVAAEQGVPMVQ